MMMVEGACRRLAPEANFWELSKPFLEEWVSQNLSAEARVRDTIEEAAATARKIPNMLEKAQMAADVLTPEGIRLHPDSERAIGSQFGSRRNFVQFVLILVITIFTLVILFKL
jgi:ubiquinone biosynthesis protein